MATTADKMWKELKKNQLVKYGAVTTVSTISKSQLYCLASYLDVL